jgi:hypothetical protein
LEYEKAVKALDMHYEVIKKFLELEKFPWRLLFIFALGFGIVSGFLLYF